MTHKLTTRTGLFALLMAGVAIPAAAQETVSPPTINTPAPAAQPPAASAPAPAASPGITFAPQAAVVQTAPPPAPPPESVRNPAPEPGAGAPRTTTTRAAAPRAAPAARAVAVAPVTAAPTVAEAAPIAAPSPDVTPAPVAAEPVAAAEPAAAQPASEGEVSSFAAWGMLALAGAAIIGLIAFLVARRRRRAEQEFVYDEVYEEPAAAAAESAYAEPAYVEPAPIAAAPTAIAPAMVDESAGRPWIDIGLRPVRADESLQVEVTVSNSGDAPARDVRVSTWMLNGTSTEGELALIDARSDAQTATVNVAAGADESVDSVLTLPHAGTPILVAEARYPLPQGGEGRIAATFEIETNGEPDHVEARLHEVIERA